MSLGFIAPGNLCPCSRGSRPSPPVFGAVFRGPGEAAQLVKNRGWALAWADAPRYLSGPPKCGLRLSFGGDSPGESSNGRTWVSGTHYLGSNPSSPTIRLEFRRCHRGKLGSTRTYEGRFQRDLRRF